MSFANWASRSLQAHLALLVSRTGCAHRHYGVGNLVSWYFVV